MELPSLVDDGGGAHNYHTGDETVSHNLSVQLELRLSWSAKLETGEDDEGRSFGDASDLKKEIWTSSPTSRGMEQERAWWRCSAKEERMDGRERRKLRLSREQSYYLEESFKNDTTVTPKQKVAIAKQLGLRPRQVEVWFQNRRARTKLKKMEVEREYLKQWHKNLGEENRRLQKEIQELKATDKPVNSHHIHMHARRTATLLAVCPSCGQAAAANRE